VRSERLDSPNSLFVMIDIGDDARPGELEIAFLRDAQVVARHPWRLEAREPAPGRGFDARDAIYLVTPDRCANGDPSNDSVPGMREAADRAGPYGRHGGDIAGLRRHLDYIAGLGFTMLWPTPLLENDQDQQSYHGYAITD